MFLQTGLRNRIAITKLSTLRGTLKLLQMLAQEEWISLFSAFCFPDPRKRRDKHKEYIPSWGFVLPELDPKLTRKTDRVKMRVPISVWPSIDETPPLARHSDQLSLVLEAIFS